MALQKPTKPKPKPPTPEQTRARVQADQEKAQRQFMSWLMKNAQYYMGLIGNMRPRTMQQDMQLARSLFPDYSGRILGNAALRRQATSDINSVFAPQLRHIEDIYRRRAQQGTAAIQGFTGSYMDRLGGIAPELIKDQNALIDQSRMLNETIAGYAKSRAGELAGGLEADLQGINASPGLTEATAGANEALAENAAGVMAASGGASVQRMIESAMPYQAYARNLPAYGASEGLRALQDFQRNINSSMREDIGGIQARMPEFTYNVYQNLLGQNQNLMNLGMQRGSNIANFIGQGQDRNQALILGQIGSALNAAQLFGNLYQGAGSNVIDTLPPFPDPSDNPLLDPQERRGAIFSTMADFVNNERQQDLAFWGPGGRAFQRPGEALNRLIKVLTGGFGMSWKQAFPYAQAYLRSLGINYTKPTPPRAINPPSEQGRGSFTPFEPSLPELKPGGIGDLWDAISGIFGGFSGRGP